MQFSELLAVRSSTPVSGHKHWGGLHQCTETVSDVECGLSGLLRRRSGRNGQQAVPIVSVFDSGGGISAGGSVSVDSSPDFLFPESEVEKLHLQERGRMFSPAATSRPALVLRPFGVKNVWENDFPSGFCME